MCLFWILSNKLDLNQEPRFTIKHMNIKTIYSKYILMWLIKIGSYLQKIFKSSRLDLAWLW